MNIQMSYSRFILMKNLVVFGHGYAKNNSRHIFETMDPLLSLGTLATDIKQSIMRNICKRNNDMRTISRLLAVL